MGGKLTLDARVGQSRQSGLMPRLLLSLALSAALVVSLSAGQRGPTLDIYVVDTEGGKAALYVTPSGEAVLIDTGNHGGRDAGRIMEAVTDARLTQIDYLVSTHYHLDHVGGMLDLARRVPIRHFIDHGPSVEEREQVEGFQAAYAALRAGASHQIVKPGDRLQIAGVDWRIVTSAAQVLKTPLPGGGHPNASCASSPARNPNTREDSQSVGSVVTFGQFRVLDLGDLPWNQELELMCPTNPIGAVDLYMVSAHGLAGSGSEALVHGVSPRVAVMQNSPRKGASLQAMNIMRTSPGLEDIWQLHWSYVAGVEQNSAGAFIANLEEPATLAAQIAPGAAAVDSAAAAHTPAHWIKISARSDGTFTITNSRTDFRKTYLRR